MFGLSCDPSACDLSLKILLHRTHVMSFLTLFIACRRKMESVNDYDTDIHDSIDGEEETIVRKS
jgi:hypothetical protein